MVHKPLAIAFSPPFSRRRIFCTEDWIVARKAGSDNIRTSTTARSTTGNLGQSQASTRMIRNDWVSLLPVNFLSEFFMD